ncbi:MAG: DUF2062 domain-containing protein [Thermodesulfobacteriota bacterium]
MKLIYLRMMRIDDPPERIARGAAIGVCMGILPTFGAGIVLAFLLAFVFRANKAAAVLGSFIMNPLTSPFFWTLSIVLGSFITGQDSAAIMGLIRQEGILKGAEWAYIVFMAGNVIVTGTLTTAAYFFIKAAVIRHRKHKAERRRAR